MNKKFIFYLCIIILPCLCLNILALRMFQNKMRNPYLVEIQEQLEEAGIEDLQVQLDYGKDALSGIVFEGQERFYQSEEALHEVEQVQKLAVSYLIRHPEAYSELFIGYFKIDFINTDVRNNHPDRTVFSFHQTDKKLHEDTKGMERLIIRGGYRYKISQLIHFPEVKEFGCHEMELDGEEVLNHLPNVQRIEFYDVTGGNQKSFIQAARKKEIAVDSIDIDSGV